MAAFFGDPANGLMRLGHAVRGDYALAFKYQHRVAPTSGVGNYALPFSVSTGVDAYAAGTIAYIYTNLDDVVLEFDTFVSGSSVGTVSAVIPLQTTLRIAYVRQGATHRFYLKIADGPLRLLGTLTADLSAAVLSDLRLGSDTHSTFPSGPIWDVWELARAPLLTELALLDTPAAGLVQNPFSWAPLSVGQLDYSPYQRHYTVVGGVTFGTSPDLTVEAVEVYSDQALHHPAGYMHGPAEPLVLGTGVAERRLSERFTGAWEGPQINVDLSDKDGRWRRRLAMMHEGQERWWNANQVLDMTTRDNAAVLGPWARVFTGPIVSAKTLSDLRIRFTLGDNIAQSIVNGENQVPWRTLGDGFLDELDEVSEGLDRNDPEPIVYGKHIRLATDPASPEGLAFPPKYLGIEVLTGGAHDGESWHVWMIAGHACADVPNVLVDGASVLGDEGTQWLIPHSTGHDTQFGANYQDRRSKRFGNDRRYTLLYGKVTDLAAEGDALTDPDACALGERELLVMVHGIEPSGVGEGAVITDRFLQWLHFEHNYGAHFGQAGYQSGPWRTSSPLVDADSFLAASAIGLERIPVDGYIGAFIIGLDASERRSLPDVEADLARSCGAQRGWTRFGQVRCVLLHPTEAIKAAAPIYTDVTEVLDDEFETDPQFDDQVNRVPFAVDYDRTTGTYRTKDTAAWDQAIAFYGKTKDGELRDYPATPGSTQAFNLALIEARLRAHPYRLVTLTTTIGPDRAGDSLGYRDVGDYIRYVHYDAVSQWRQIRLAQIEFIQVDPTARTVKAIAIDCQDLVGYDLPEAPGAVVENDTCATAIEITNGVDYPYIIDPLDTSSHADDVTAGILPDDRTAYGASWWRWTAPADAIRCLITTAGSNFDTQIQVLEGSGCEALTRTTDGYNDNDGFLTTSVLEIPVTGGTTYYFQISGRNPGDVGTLLLGIQMVSAA